MKKPIFFNSATVSARERLVLRKGSWGRKKFAVRWALLPQTPLGPCLIDTGYNRFVTDGKQRSWALKLYNKLLRPKLIEEGQICCALRRYALTTDDISTIIITHFHADHISALHRFQKARFLVSGIAIDELSHSSVFRLWLKGIFPELLPKDFFARARPIEQCEHQNIQGLKSFDLFGNGACFALPLPGHARGHFGLIFPGWKLFYAVDSAWLLNTLDRSQGPSWLARLIMDDASKNEKVLEIVRDLEAKGYEIMLCHEPTRGNFDA
ncbi:MBL fold metallo-hydrolase [Bartonella sp. LJL80]